MGTLVNRHFLFTKIPVAPAVPAVSLVPPAFPVSMPVPPPGFNPIPPPPFLRASFNPSQPPPGKEFLSYSFNSIVNVVSIVNVGFEASVPYSGLQN